MQEQLTLIEARVLSSLIEKSLTTPEYYPLTLNSLISACNQKSNRNPEMQLEESDVLHALDQLRMNHKLACETASTGSRVKKYRHTLENGFSWDAQQTALLCELLLRGPQTVAELRSRCIRMTAMPSNEQTEEILNRLAEGEQPVVIRLPREPGRREARYQHLLCGMPDTGSMTRIPEEPVRTLANERDTRINTLEQKVEQLQKTIDCLQTAFEEFKKQLE